MDPCIVIELFTVFYLFGIQNDARRTTFHVSSFETKMMSLLNTSCPPELLLPSVTISHSLFKVEIRPTYFVLRFCPALTMSFHWHQRRYIKILRSTTIPCPLQIAQPLPLLPILKSTPSAFRVIHFLLKTLSKLFHTKILLDPRWCLGPWVSTDFYVRPSLPPHLGNKKQTVASDGEGSHLWEPSCTIPCSLDHEVKGLTRS